MVQTELVHASHSSSVENNNLLGENSHYCSNMINMDLLACITMACHVFILDLYLRNTKNGKGAQAKRGKYTCLQKHSVFVVSDLLN